MTLIRLHYWAGARAAAGVETDEVEAESVAAALAVARSGRDAHFGRVLGVSTVLIDGTVADGNALEQRRTVPVVAEILPPFAGGAQGS